MKEVRIKKERLLEIVKKNRAEHREIFLKAQENYRAAVIQALEEELADARDNKPFRVERLVKIVAPQDHTRDYDRVIEMLKLTEDKIIEMDQYTFANMVLDEWEWSHAWAVSNSRYTKSPKLDKYLAGDR